MDTLGRSGIQDIDTGFMSGPWVYRTAVAASDSVLDLPDNNKIPVIPLSTSRFGGRNSVILGVAANLPGVTASLYCLDPVDDLTWYFHSSAAATTEGNQIVRFDLVPAVVSKILLALPPGGVVSRSIIAHTF